LFKLSFVVLDPSLPGVTRHDSDEFIAIAMCNRAEARQNVEPGSALTDEPALIVLTKAIFISPTRS
jgi:hypothetical protein